MIKFEFSDKERVIEVFYFHYMTNEYIGKGEAHIAPHTGLPGNSTLTPPPEYGEKEIPVFDIALGEWVVMNDSRGDVAWSVETGESAIIDFIGDIPDSLTRVKPGSDFDKWNGSEWEKDTEAEHRHMVEELKKDIEIMMDYAEKQITILSRSKRLKIATSEELEKLDKWEEYTVLLSRVDPEQAPYIQMPHTP